jgi:hypothetical protein
MLIKYTNLQKQVLETCFGRKQDAVKITNKAEICERKHKNNTTSKNR